MQFKDLWCRCPGRRDDVDADCETLVQMHKWPGLTKVNGARSHGLLSVGKTSLSTSVFSTRV